MTVSTGVQIDVIQANAKPSHHPKLGAARQQGRRHLGPIADNQGIGGLNRCCQFRRLVDQLRVVNDREPVFKPINRWLIHKFANHHMGHSRHTLF